jgi:hypothetical protein
MLGPNNTGPDVLGQLTAPSAHFPSFKAPVEPTASLKREPPDGMASNGANKRRAGPPPALHVNDLPDTLLVRVWSHVPLDRNQVENRHALALVCRRWRAAAASEGAAPLWRSVQASLLLDLACHGSFPLGGMYAWFSRHAAAIQDLTLEINRAAAWTAVHALLGVTGAGLASLRIFSDSDDPCFEPRGAAPWLALLPRLESLDLEGVADTSIDAARLPPALTRVALGGCGVNGLYRVPATLSSLPRLRALSLQFMEQGADLSGLTALRTLRQVDLSNCALHAVPAELAQLPRLTALTLNNNEQLGGSSGEWVAPLGALRSLALLEMRDCALKAVPGSLTGLTTLRTLLLGYNDLTADVVIPPGPYLSSLELLAMSDSMPDPTSFADVVVRPLAAATALHTLRVNRNWGTPLSTAAVRALLKGKPGFRKLEYSEDMAPGVDLLELKARYPRVTFKVVD